MVEQE
jgi:translation initiation factor 4A